MATAPMIIRKGAFPRYGGRRITNYVYTERGNTKQTVNYTYSERDTSITPQTAQIPIDDPSVVCFVGDPTQVLVWHNGAAVTVRFANHMTTATVNAGTAHEYTFDVISSVDAVLPDNTVIGTMQYLGYAVEHLQAKDYHDFSGQGTAYLQEGTGYCTVENARGALHGIFRIADFERQYDTSGGYWYDALTGYHEQNFTFLALSSAPAVAVEQMTRTAHNCELTLSYT